MCDVACQQPKSFRLRYRGQLQDNCVPLTNLLKINAKDLGQFFELPCDMSNANGAVMGWSGLCPSIDIRLSAYRKPITAVCIANIENRSRDCFTFSYQQLQASSRFWQTESIVTGPFLTSHLDRETFARFAVIHHQWNELDFAFCNRSMCRTIMPKHNDIIIEVHHIKLGE